MKSYKFISLTSIAVLILSGCNLLQSSPSETAHDQLMESIATNAVNEGVLPEDSGSNLSGYIDYSASKLASLKGNQKFALFFHAPWCPDCRFVDNEIQENVTELPVNTTILKVDYDTETALRKEYNVPIQSVVLIFDSEGNLAETLTAPSAEKIVEAFNKTG